MGRRKKQQNGNLATVQNIGSEAVAKKSNGSKLKAPGESVNLTDNDKRWFENLVLKEQLVKQEAQAKMVRLVEDEKDMFASIKERTGVDVKGYDLDWPNLLAIPKAEAETKAKPGPKPRPKQEEQAEPQPEAQAN